MNQPSIEKIINGLRTFFSKRYTQDVASDYLAKGKVRVHIYGIDFEVPNKTYHFDSRLNFKNVTIW